jgi:hypothetical protein
MTTVALVVRRQVRRDRQRHTPPQRSGVTRAAAILWPGRATQVLRMIELQIEALFEFISEGFERWIIAINAGVADRAHRYIRGSELRQVTASAVLVTRKTGPRGIIIPMMTGRATGGCVTLAGVQEP